MKTIKPRENCIICGREIYRNGNFNSIKEIRGDYTLTCSKTCSRVYTRVKNYLYAKIKNRLRREFDKRIDKFLKEVKK